MQWQREFPWEHKRAHCTHLFECGSVSFKISSFTGLKFSLRLNPKLNVWKGCLSTVQNNDLWQTIRSHQTGKWSSTNQPRVNGSWFISAAPPPLLSSHMSSLFLNPDVTILTHKSEHVWSDLLFADMFFPHLHERVNISTVLRTNIDVGGPIGFPLPGHSRGRMMHSLWDADCYSCRYAVPLRKGEPTDDIMELHGRLSGWVRWMWADWKSQHSLCRGTKSSCGEDTSYSVSIKTWVSRRKLNCTVYSTSAKQQIIPQERLAVTCSRSLIWIWQHQDYSWIRMKLKWNGKLIFRNAD